jgi:hypothetical protein
VKVELGQALQTAKEAAMTEHSLQISTAEKMQITSVADYIVQRIADEGAAHCFGVAGDYLFPMCNAVERSPRSTGSVVRAN